MSHAERRDLVVANKNKGAGRGIKRDVQLLETASCEDSLGLDSKKPFLTKKQLLIGI